VVTGMTDFETRLVLDGPLCHKDLSDIREHSAREHLQPVDSIAALGLMSESEAYAALASVAGLPFVSLEGRVVSELALRLVPEGLARQYQVVPLSLDHGVLTYATCRPPDAAVQRDLSFASGRGAEAVLTTRSAVRWALDRWYSKERELARPAARPLAADTQDCPGERTRHRVLVTDDEPITRMLVRLMLEREDYEVLEAGNGREAVEIVARERPDVLLIDLNMPEMDGEAAIVHLRRAPVPVTIPIIVLTSDTESRVERRVLDLGADDYITKPFDPAVLLSRVQAVFRRLNAVAA